MPQDTRVGGGGGYGRIQLPNTSRYARCSRATESRTPYPENSSGLLSRNRAGQCLFRTGCTGHRSLIDRAASCIDQRPNQRCQRHDGAAAPCHRVAPADASARFWWHRRMVHLAAVPSRGRAPLGASSAARSAHATEVERWWVAVPRCGARVLRTRTAPLPAATNLVAAGPLCSHSGCLPAKRHLQVVPWHPGEVRPWILPSNATALLGENDGLGAEIEMQLVVQRCAPARTHRDSLPQPTRPP
jgi:hypothetical protein